MINFNRHSGNYDITCDRCSIEFLEIEANSFIEAVGGLKQEGWNVFKNDSNEWTHTCLACGLLD